MKTRPAEKLIERYLKEDDADDKKKKDTESDDDEKDKKDEAEDDDKDEDDDEKDEDEDPSAKVKEALDALAQEHGMKPVDMEANDDGVSGTYTAKGLTREAAAEFAKAAKEALDGIATSCEADTSGKVATVEFMY